MSQRVERALITAILAIFVLLGFTYSIVTPVFEASDEKWHYPMVKYIADHWALPVQDPEVVTPWRQEGSQAPLYYVISAVATFWIDTSDMSAVRHINPHVDAGATPDGNINLVVHDPALDRFPWQGTVLAVHIIRFLSVLMSAAAVFFTYIITREVLPDQPVLALGTAAIHATTCPSRSRRGTTSRSMSGPSRVRESPPTTVTPRARRMGSGASSRAAESWLPPMSTMSRPGKRRAAVPRKR